MLIVKNWGRMEYGEAEKRQLELFENKISLKAQNVKTDDYLIFVEHDPVYTLGKNADEANILPIARLSGASFHHISRGGDVTYHGPGQMVVYPIIDLQNFKLGIRGYVTALEEIGVQICKDYGIEAKASQEEGVWIDLDSPRARKIMAIGIKVSRYVTMHGIAFNVNTDLNYFNFIIPCGIRNKGVTSLERELSRPIVMDEVCARFENYFCMKFGALNPDGR